MWLLNISADLFKVSKPNIFWKYWEISDFFFFFFWKRLHWLGFIFFLEVFVESYIRNSHREEKESSLTLPWQGASCQQLVSARAWQPPGLGGTFWLWLLFVQMVEVSTPRWAWPQEPCSVALTEWKVRNVFCFCHPMSLRLYKASAICRWCLVCRWWDKQMTCLCH